MVNLLCATGLPGSEDLDIGQCLATLDQWAQVVAVETERFRPNFRPNPSCPTDARYRCYMLIKVVRDGFGLRHHLLPDKGTGFTGIIDQPADGSSGFEDSRPLFIHGLLGPDRIGSCTSLPVVYAAVGRRLGYPIKLGLAVGHVFIRWDSPGELFNMDGSGPDYITTPSDDGFIDKPRPWTQHEKTCGYYMRSITPVEELAVFLSVRAACLMHTGQLGEAAAMMAKAAQLAPGDPMYPRQLWKMQQRLARLPKRPAPARSAGLDVSMEHVGPWLHKPRATPFVFSSTPIMVQDRQS